MKDLDYLRELCGYLIGFGLALVLTLIPFALIVPGGLNLGPFALVARADVSPETTMIILGVCALLQMVVHLRLFLHIDLSLQKREDLQLILFSVLLLTIMAGGTIWIMNNLGMRM